MRASRSCARASFALSSLVCGALVLFAIASGCASGSPSARTCATASDCAANETCLDERCVPRSDPRDAAVDDGAVLPDAPPTDAPPADAPPTDAPGVDGGPLCSACDDSNACTDDTCEGGVCDHTPVDCDDANACTTDICDPETGCASAAISCDDADACTVDACDPALGCTHDRPVVPGDLCSNAVDVSAGGTFAGSLACATNVVEGACGASTSADVQHVLTLAEPRRVRFTLTGEGNPILAIGRSCGGADVACGASDLLLDPGTYYVTVDAGTSTAGTFSLGVELLPFPAPETVTFPIASDPRVAASGTNYWRTGDYVQGVRATSLPRARRAVVSLGFPSNGLTCDVLPMRVRLNGTEVGSFTITPGLTRATPTFDFTAIAGPSFTLRYETMRQVASGCGSVTFDQATSTVQLHP